MATFYEKDGYTVEDLLHFGFGHADAACSLFEDPDFLDSAGYLAHLGTELILKAWHLHWFGQYNDTHELVALYQKIKENQAAASLSKANENFIAELQRFYQLRYPRRAKGPIEIGTEHLHKFNELLDDLWQHFPNEIVETYENIDPSKKGGRVLMKKKINGTKTST